MYLVTKTYTAPLSVANTVDDFTNLIYSEYEKWMKSRKKWDWTSKGTLTSRELANNTLDRMKHTGELAFYRTNNEVGDETIMIERHMLFNDEAAYHKRCRMDNIDIAAGDDVPDLSSVGITTTVTKEDV